MSYEYVIDSHAWIEYFRGSVSGDKARNYIEGDSAATSVLSLAELKEKYLREKWASFDEDLSFMATRTSLVPVDRQIATLAGEINHKQKMVKRGWGMTDSIILATARTANAKVVTGDHHFDGLSEAIII
jgi:predicted nucleic acid-binding protein